MSSYLVWCLSWDDTEEQATTIQSYDPVVGSRIDTRLLYEVPFYSLESPKEAAEVYADWIHARRDAWEATWPLTFRVRSPDGTEQDFEVDRAMVPEFSARKVSK